MGASSSKVARSAPRKYPARTPGAAVPRGPPRPKPAAKPKSKTLGDGTKDEGNLLMRAMFHRLR